MEKYGLIRSKEGYIYRTEKRTYSLYEGVTIQGIENSYTSDILFIMADNDETAAKFVDFIYGASGLDQTNPDFYLIEAIGRIINNYEMKEDQG